MENHNLVPFTVFLTRRFKAMSKEDLIRFIKESFPNEEEILLKSRRRDTLEEWAIESLLET